MDGYTHILSETMEKVSPFHLFLLEHNGVPFDKEMFLPIHHFHSPHRDILYHQLKKLHSPLAEP